MQYYETLSNLCQAKYAKLAKGLSFFVSRKVCKGVFIFFFASPRSLREIIL